MVGCFILGCGTIFNFEIGRYNDFTELRKAIWEDDKDYFESIGCNEKKLKLWKVKIPTRNNAKYLELKKNPCAEINVQQEFGGEELDPTWEVAESFSTTPMKEHIHIIVQIPPPPPATTGKCLPMVYLSNKKFQLSFVVIFAFSPSYFFHNH
jgi:hypothetical protein